MSEVGNVSEQLDNVAAASVDIPHEKKDVNNIAEAAAAIKVSADVLTKDDVRAAGDAGVDVSSAATEAAEEAEPLTKPEKKTPAKRTPSKRLSFIERAQKESEELVKNMGGSLELEGGRRTRSSTRGTPTRTTVTPPPAKKARSSPANAGGGATTPSRARGRGRKLNISAELSPQEPAKTPPQDEKEATETEVVVPVASEADNTSATTSEEVTKPENNEAAENSTSKNVDINADDVDATQTLLEKATASVVEELTDDKPTITSDKPSEEQLSRPDQKEEAVPEKQNKEIELEPTKSEDSPMETDEESPQVVPAVTVEAEEPDEEQVEEASTAIAEAAVVEPAVDKEPLTDKEPTPEPMEVDSSSKSSDATPVENAIITATPVTGNFEIPAQQQRPKETNAELHAAQPISNAIAVHEEAEQSIAVEPTVENTACAVNVAVTPAATVNSAVAETDSAAKQLSPADILNSAAAAVLEKAQVNENDGAAAANSKTENNFCEPKIASPSANTATNDGAVSTPQYCN